MATNEHAPERQEAADGADERKLSLNPETIADLDPPKDGEAALRGGLELALSRACPGISFTTCGCPAIGGEIQPAPGGALGNFTAICQKP